MTIAQWLRALPVAGEDLPDVDLDRLPEDPITLVVDSIRHAVDAGVPAPHAMTLATADPAGLVSARALILKDATGDRLAFATRRDSFKAAQLAANPRAAVVFLWPAVGDQLRAYGPVIDLGDEASAADFLARNPYSRASCVTGHQGEELPDRDVHAAAFTAALEKVTADPDYVDPDWRAMALVPDAVEWWHTSRAGQVRVVYERAGEDAARVRWRRFLRWP
ncbi:pyridoxine/pyridoxamine 5'-phosphate oxidase [Georgenia alba]|uniref:Pyridoxal 5'-phosphate synthase n=1 Tax=Georgenia alba TaxID=2233858 RepID=A0ABW2Q7I0_9MICO